ncbi:hypothetical protein ACCS78_38105, partial [Rhizobium johnstonii]
GKVSVGKLYGAISFASRASSAAASSIVNVSTVEPSVGMKHHSRESGQKIWIVFRAKLPDEKRDWISGLGKIALPGLFPIPRIE